MTIQEIKDYLCERGHENAVVFDNPAYADAFVGVSHDGRAIYDYNKMVDCLAEEMTEEEAAEFIDYNTIRSLPYVENSPIILYPTEEP